MDTFQKKTSKAVSSKLKRWAAIIGIPCVMHGDRGPAFSANHFIVFCRDLGVRHMRTSAYYPKFNGQAEHMIQEVRKVIKKSLCDTDRIMMSLNHLERPWGMGTPNKILFNRKVKGQLPNSRNEKMDIQEIIQRKLKRAEE